MITRYPDLNLNLTFHPVQCDHPRRLLPAQIEHFNREGYVTDITVFEGERLREIQTFFEQSYCDPGSSEEFHAYHYLVPELYDIVTDSAYVEHLQDLLGPNVVCYVSQYVTKPPGSPQEVGWHQDAWFDPMDARSVVAWLAVYDADIENGCMWFIPGSHLKDPLDHTEGRIGDGSFTGNSALRAEDWDKRVPIELKAGQAVLFSELLLHGSPGNRSARLRGGFTATFTAADNRPYAGWDQYGVLCSGTDSNGYWVHHTRP